MTRLTSLLIAVATASPAVAQDAREADPVPAAIATPETESTAERRPRPPRARPQTLSAVPPQQGAFETWLDAFRGRALTRGVRRDVVDGALDGLLYMPDVVGAARDRAAVARPIREYLDAAVSEDMIAAGRAALDDRSRLFDAIETRYGVEREILAAIWGVESTYGTRRGDTDLIAALATLARDGERPAFFESQLVAALKILETGDVSREALRGTPVGTMGHTQIVPTTYLVQAVDFNGDGRRDVWGDSPADALASAASGLAAHGWVKGMPWGVEVRVADGFDYRLARRDERRLPSDWAALGVTGVDGEPVPDFGEASVLLPAGSEGAAFLIFQNFHVLERVNTADAYVIGVGHLADRLAGKGPLQADWPSDDRALTEGERMELQRRLTAAGFDTQGVDGKIGPLTIAAVRAYQRSAGMVPDGYASLRVLRRLRAG
ncbi:lytic murein transglycosylase [Palleronia rufa]|uniref:lytic murein transglycosylase n=1 Tax=Palleronia rufa TaxID=1530186 RepID=UPI00055E8918|nr:lytic murein transglycosylase [Palleronia rufa]